MDQLTNWTIFLTNSHLIRVIWEVDFVEDLGGLVLDRFHFHLVWWILPLTMSQCLLQSLD